MSADRPPRLPILAAVADPERDFPFVPGNTAELLINGVRFEHDLRGSHRLTREEFERRPWYLKLADHFAGLFRWFL